MDQVQMATLLDTVRRRRPRPSTLEERLQLLEDEQEIAGLLLTYAWLCDAHRWDEIWSLYTDDFERRIESAPSEDVNGIAEVHAMYTPLLHAERDAIAAGEAIRYHVRGIVSPPLVRIADGGAEAEALTVYNVSSRYGLEPGAAAELRRVCYRWRLRRTADGWRFSGLTVLNDDAPAR
jgi:hypothetical protein